MDRIIYEAKNIIEKDIYSRDFLKYDKIYPYTTEMLSKYLNNLENKSVLSVIGSGDQFLNSSLLGANNIDSFDINIFAIKYLNLKIAACLSLDKEEFYDFLGGDALKYFNRVREFLYYGDINFWNWYVNNIVKHKGIQSSNLFYPKSGIYSNKNLYMNTLGYTKLQQNLHKINNNNNNYWSDINDLNLDNKYDVILLSNICEYQDDMEKFSNTVNRLYSNNLKDNGIIYYAYFNSKDNPNMNYLTSLFTDTKIIDIIPGSHKDNDKVLSLRK